MRLRPGRLSCRTGVNSLGCFWYNVRMKMQIGVGVAMLSALAAEGKDFDRDELNAMLDLSEH